MTKNISDKANTYLQMPDWTQVCRAREQDTKQLRPQVIIITYQQEKKPTFVGTESKTTGSKAHCKHQPILSLLLGVFAKIQ